MDRAKDSMLYRNLPRLVNLDSPSDRRVRLRPGHGGDWRLNGRFTCRQCSCASFFCLRSLCSCRPTSSRRRSPPPRWSGSCAIRAPQSCRARALWRPTRARECHARLRLTNAASSCSRHCPPDPMLSELRCPGSRRLPLRAFNWARARPCVRRLRSNWAQWRKP